MRLREIVPWKPMHRTQIRLRSFASLLSSIHTKGTYWTDRHRLLSVSHHIHTSADKPKAVLTGCYYSLERSTCHRAAKAELELTSLRTLAWVSYISDHVLSEPPGLLLTNTWFIEMPSTLRRAKCNNNTNMSLQLAWCDISSAVHLPACPKTDPTWLIHPWSVHRFQHSQIPALTDLHAHRSQHSQILRTRTFLFDSILKMDTITFGDRLFP